MNNENNFSNKNQIEISICNIKYSLTTTEKEEYIQGIAKYINNKISEVSKTHTINTNSIPFFITIALNIADDLFRQRKLYSKNAKELDYLNNNIEKLKQDNFKITDFKNLLALKDNEIEDLSNSLALKDNEIIALSNSLALKNNEILELNNALTLKNNETKGFKTSLALKDNEIEGFKTSLALKDNEIHNIKNLLAQKDKQIAELQTLSPFLNIIKEESINFLQDNMPEKN